MICVFVVTWRQQCLSRKTMTVLWNCRIRSFSKINRISRNEMSTTHIIQKYKIHNRLCINIFVFFGFRSRQIVFLCKSRRHPMSRTGVRKIALSLLYTRKYVRHLTKFDLSHDCCGTSATIHTHTHALFSSVYLGFYT